MMTKHLGRPLEKEEVVHHINMIKDDDRIENLHLFKNKISHMKSHHSFNKLAKKLLKKGMIKFENEEYKLI